MTGSSGYSVQHGELGGRPTVALRSARAELEATFVPKLGMIGCSLTHRGDELVALPGGLEKYAEQGSAMGIPFLHPWANRLSGFEYLAEGKRVVLDPDSPLLHLDPNGLPIHGVLAASSLWEVREAVVREDAAVLVAELDFGAHADLMAAFPFPHVVRQEVRLGRDVLKIETTVEATGDVAVPICFGFHPYLQLPGVPREQWMIDLPVEREILVDESMIPTGKTRPVRFDFGALGDRSFDTGFEGILSRRPFVVEGGGRRVELSMLDGYPFAQVFSPPGAEFICFEPMTAPANALANPACEVRHASAGQAASASFSVAVSDR